MAPVTARLLAEPARVTAMVEQVLVTKPAWTRLLIVIDQFEEVSRCTRTSANGLVSSTVCWPRPAGGRGSCSGRAPTRRDELIAELSALGYLKRPVWVLEQLETALTEGCQARIQARRERAARTRRAKADALLSRVEAELTQLLSRAGDGKVEVRFRREDAQELMLRLFHERSTTVGQ